MDIKDKSNEIRRNRNRSLIMLFLFPVYGVVTFSVLGLVGAPENYILVFALPYMAYFLWVGFKWSYSTCPMCMQPMFHNYYFFYGLFKCVYCGYDLKDPKSSKNYAQ